MVVGQLCIIAVPNPFVKNYILIRGGSDGMVAALPFQFNERYLWQTLL